MQWTVPNLFFVIAIGIFTAWLTFLTTKGSLTNNKFKGLFRRLTFRGRITVFVLLSITTLLLAQELNNQNMSNNKDRALKIEQNKRDSLITAGINQGVDSVSNELYQKLSIAFSKQNLKIDTLKNKIIDLSAADKTTNYITEKDPTILVSSEPSEWSGIYLLEDRYSITIESHGAGSTNFNIEFYVLIKFNDGSKKIEKPLLFVPSTKILTKMRATLTTTTKDIKELYFYMTGSYSNLSMSKNYTVDYLGHYDPVKKITFGLTGNTKKQILDEILKLD